VEGHVVRSLEREDVQRHRLVFPVIIFFKKEKKRRLVSLDEEKTKKDKRDGEDKILLRLYTRASASRRFELELSILTR